MIAKTCRCGGRIRNNECDRCGPVQQQEYRGTSAERGYGGRWQRESERYKREHPLCVACEAQGVASGQRGRTGVLVDHIVPASMCPDLFWDQSNWQTLCHHCDQTIKKPLERQHSKPEALVAEWAKILGELTNVAYQVTERNDAYCLDAGAGSVRRGVQWVDEWGQRMDRPTVSEWNERYRAMLDRYTPEGCTRRRMKPYIDSCECDWCRELDDLLMDRPAAVTRQDETGSNMHPSGGC